jgi:CheY-like chemotaxis protein
MLDINILVVDDNDGDLLLFEESIEIVQEFLSEKDIIVNFAVKTASDGLDALEIIEKVNINFDIIFLDIKMPKMDGIECLEKINENKNNTYVVMFTTSDYEEDIKKTHALGANGYLLKSLDIMEFEENLKSTLMLFIQDNFVYFNTVRNKYKNSI